MKSIREVATRPLEWTQPSMLKREHELRAGDELLAHLRWDNAFGSRARAESAAGAWTLKRSGFLSPRVTARVDGTEIEVLALRPSWTGQGTIEVAQGARYGWSKPSFWHSEWVMADTAERPLVRFKPRFSMVRQSTEVILEPKAVELRDLELLLAFGWYLMVLMAEDGRASAGSTVAAGA